MYNSMNGGNITEQLGLGSGVKELKFGSSFTNPGASHGRSSQGKFHTAIRYDFKPASVDTTKMGSLEVSTDNQVTVSVPNLDGNGTTSFKGPKKPANAKECVLIIDHETGEIILEKLSHNIQVKKTRQEGSSRINSSAGSSKTAPAPAPETLSSKSTKYGASANNNQNYSKKKSTANSSTSSSHHSSSSVSKSAIASSRSPMLHPPPKHSPLGRSPGRFSPDVKSTSTLQPPSSSMPSLNSIEDLLITDEAEDEEMPSRNVLVGTNKSKGSKATPPKEVGKNTQPATNTAKNVGLSDSSSDSSSSSSSDSSDDDDEDDDMEVVPDEIPIPKLPNLPTISHNKGVGGSSGLVYGNNLPGNKSNNSGFSSRGSNNGSSTTNKNNPSLMSMPTDLLSEDLQLSDSGSDMD